MRETSNMFILDGIDITDNDVRQPSIRPSVDAIQEFKVQNSTFSAEYGRQAGGMINVTTKSGTNEMHGTAYEFVRNNIFDAKNFFDPPNQETPPLRRNQFGGTIGGPLKKDRTFFFGNYEQLIERAAQTRAATVPKPEWLTGDFSSLLDPSLGSRRVQLRNPLTGQDFAGNIIPAGMLNPTSLLAAKVYPTQNTGSTGPLGDQFVSAPTLKTDSYLMTGRIDHQILTEQQHLREVVIQPREHSRSLRFFLGDFRSSLLCENRRYAQPGDNDFRYLDSDTNHRQ